MYLGQAIFAGLLVLSVLLLSACSETGFYWQAVSGHFKILNQKQKIQDILQDPQSPELLKHKLKLIRKVRQFAVESMKLPRPHGYTSYVDLKQSYVSVVVTAAPELSLKAHSWCYLIIGCQDYRGYFKESDALSYRKKLIKEFEQKDPPQTLDTSIGYVKAYSTLNWLNNDWVPSYFSDPVLNTFIERSDINLIRTLIHEMAHQVLFVAGDTSFNESFAVFVEQEGLRQYLNQELEQAKKTSTERYQKYLQEQKDRELFRNMINGAFVQLQKVYESESSDETKRIQKSKIFATLKENYAAKKKEFRVLSYDAWFARDLNNAHLLGVRRYQNNVSHFAQIFEQQHQEWTLFFDEVKKLADSPAPRF